jgi:hypothetical protein
MIVGVVSLGASAFRRDRARAISLRRAGASGLVALAIVGALSFAQRPICDALGGSWVPEREACRGEWGGNGYNDSGEGIPPFLSSP